MKDWYNELNSVDVSKYIKEKNGQRYLSWMNAWMELKKRFPLSRSQTHETAEGFLVWKDPIGCHVKTSVTIVWEEDDGLHEFTETDKLPCMDYKNKAIPYEEVDSMVVNKTIQRSITRCIAKLGLGAFIYANEDLPEELTEIMKLQVEVTELMKKKASISKEIQNKVGDFCKAAEKEYMPEADDSEITGNPARIFDLDILKKLKRQLQAIRAVPKK